MLLQSIWVTLMVKALVDAVLKLPKLAAKLLQEVLLAGIYMCSPVLMPQMIGGAEQAKIVKILNQVVEPPFPPGLDTEKISV